MIVFVICNILAQIDFNPLGGPSTKIIKGANSTSGDSNGLSLVIDTEAYDHGYTAAAGVFFKSFARAHICL